MKIRTESIKIENESLIFKCNFEKTYRVDEFLQIQKSSVNGITMLLNNTWPFILENTINQNLTNIGQGWLLPMNQMTRNY